MVEAKDCPKEQEDSIQCWSSCRDLIALSAGEKRGMPSKQDLIAVIVGE